MHQPRYAWRKKPPRTIVIKDGAYILSCDDQDNVTVQPAQSIIIHDGIIQEIVRAGKEGNILRTADLVYDAGLRGGIVLTPGFVNAHAHPPMYLLRSTTLITTPYATTEESLEVARKIERTMDADDQYIATLGDFTEQQKVGTTSILSHYHTPEPIFKAAQAARVRLVNATSIASKTDPSANIESAIQAVQYHDDLITPAFTIHTLASVSADDLVAVRNVLERFPETLLTIHCGETDAEVAAIRQRHGKLPVHVLHEAGLLSPRLILSHAVHFTGEEISLLAKYKVGVVHLPTSNRIHKSGRFDYATYFAQQAGNRIALGTDSVISKNRLDMVSEAFQSKIMHQDGPQPVSYTTLFQMLTVNGARVLNMEHKIGKLLPGYQADIAFWKLKDRMFVPYNFDNLHTLLGNMITHAGYTVRDLMIAGQFVVQDRRHQLVNESELLINLQKRHNLLLERIKEHQ